MVLGVEGDKDLRTSRMKNSEYLLQCRTIKVVGKGVVYDGSDVPVRKSPNMYDLDIRFEYRAVAV